MKLSDFSLNDVVTNREESYAAQAVFNRTRTEYPRDSTVSGVFAQRAAQSPDAPAVLDGEHRYSYQELDRYANCIARFLLERGLQPETLVGLILSQPFHLAAAMLGVLRSGGAYLPLDPSMPPARIQYMLDDSRAPFLLGERHSIRLLNQLHWDCPALHTLLCIDSDDIYAEPEPMGEMMKRELWDHVGQQMFDAISGGGWKSSYTGEWLSQEAMEQYADNVGVKLAPFIGPVTRVLEIGCGSGISLCRLAPPCGFYYGIDLSGEILHRTGEEVARRGLGHVRLRQRAAHGLDGLDEADFDIVVLNGVVHCFSGHNYLRAVLDQAVQRLRPQGLIFLGGLPDPARKAEFVESLRAFQQDHAGAGYRPQLDRSQELFVARAFLEDLQHDIPAIQAVEISRSLGTIKSELTEYSYDALLHIDRTHPNRPAKPRHKHPLDRRALAAVPDDPMPEQGGPESLAYVMYTSGTTGQPKGVMVEHRPILRLVLNTNYIQLDATDRILQSGALGFDATTFEIWGALLNGGAFARAGEAALLDPPRLKVLIRSDGITTLFLTTGLFNQLVDQELDLFTGLRYLLTGGERCSPRHFNRLREFLPGLRLIHVYGPTENTTFTTYHPIDRAYSQDIPIGQPVANTEVLILEGDEPVPVGVVGELCAGGDGLARGYLNEPELTRHRFVPHPFAPGRRLYRTGDLARWQADGTLEFLGRIDQQVKIRGFRVEPGEIENRLRKYPGVREATVIVREQQGEKTLVAYVTGVANLDLGALRTHLRLTLPEYMIPAHFIRLERLPLTANGKLDVRALPPPMQEQQEGLGSYVPPSTETEQQLVGIWETVLERQGIGVTDNFFALGGYSLKVLKLAALVQGRMGLELPLLAVFKAPTVRDLARCLVAQAAFGVAGLDEAMVLMGGDRGRPLFAFPPGRSDALGYTRLAAALGCPFYGFNFIEADNRLQEYVDLILSVDPQGPYRLFGYSGGGRLAYHVAAVLEGQGRVVSDIIMADATRFLAPIPVTAEEVDAIVTGFMGQAEAKEVLGNALLRDKAYQRIRRYYDYLYNTVDMAVVNADIHLLLAEHTQVIYTDLQGRMLADTWGWGELTRGRFTVHPASGEHNVMFDPPHLQANAELLQTFLS